MDRMLTQDKPLRSVLKHTQSLDFRVPGFHQNSQGIVPLGVDLDLKIADISMSNAVRQCSR